MRGNSIGQCELAHKPGGFFPPRASSSSSTLFSCARRFAGETERAHLLPAPNPGRKLLPRAGGEGRCRRDLAARLPCGERNHPVWLVWRDGGGVNKARK